MGEPYVACANSTKVSVIDPHDGSRCRRSACALYPAAPSGNTPNSLALTPDGRMLFVANADANNVAVFNVAEPWPAGRSASSRSVWYPTSVRLNAAGQKDLRRQWQGILPNESAGPDPVSGRSRKSSSTSPASSAAPSPRSTCRRRNADGRYTKQAMRAVR